MIPTPKTDLKIVNWLASHYHFSKSFFLLLENLLKLWSFVIISGNVKSMKMSRSVFLKIFSSQEEELRKSGEAKYAHLSDELHVLIEVFAPPGEAYSRMSHALEEIKKFLVPVSDFFYFTNCFLSISILNCVFDLY